MQTNDNPLKSCIDACQRCYDVCLEAASDEQVELTHFRLLMACAKVCRASGALMLINNDRHRLQCGVCADICEECATDCERLGGMDDCVAACRACVRECRAIASREMAA